MLVATPTARSGLAPVETALTTLRRRRGPDSTRGIVPGLLVPDPEPGWISASTLVSGAYLDELLDAAKQRWGASPAAAASLTWRSYAYWLALPVALAWGTARRVPLVDPEDLLFRFSANHSQPLVTFGLRRIGLAVLPDDPLAPEAGVTIVTSEGQLLRRLRTSLRDAHLDRLLAQLQARVRLGTRTLLGSLASAVAYGVVRGLAAPPAAQAAVADTLLSALDVADLVTLEPGPDGLTVRRRTCCLAFTLPEPKLCSGCCITAAVPAIG